MLPRAEVVLSPSRRSLRSPSSGVIRHSAYSGSSNSPGSQYGGSSNSPGSHEGVRRMRAPSCASTGQEIWEQTDGKVDGFVSSSGTAETAVSANDLIDQIRLGRARAQVQALCQPPTGRLFHGLVTLERLLSELTQGRVRAVLRCLQIHSLRQAIRLRKEVQQEIALGVRSAERNAGLWKLGAHLFREDRGWMADRWIAALIQNWHLKATRAKAHQAVGSSDKEMEDLKQHLAESQQQRELTEQLLRGAEAARAEAHQAVGSSDKEMEDLKQHLAESQQAKEHEKQQRELTEQLLREAEAAQDEAHQLQCSVVAQLEEQLHKHNEGCIVSAPESNLDSVRSTEMLAWGRVASKLNSVEQQLATVKAAKRTQDESLGGVEAELASLTAQLDSLKGGSSGDAVQLAEAQGTVAELEAKLSSTEQQLAVVEAARRTQDESLSGVEAELASANAQLESLKGGSSGDAVQLAEAQGRVAELEGKLSSTEQQLAEVEAAKRTQADSTGGVKVTAAATDGASVQPCSGGTQIPTDQVSADSTGGHSVLLQQATSQSLRGVHPVEPQTPADRSNRLHTSALNELNAELERLRAELHDAKIELVTARQLGTSGAEMGIAARTVDALSQQVARRERQHSCELKFAQMSEAAGRLLESACVYRWSRRTWRASLTKLAHELQIKQLQLVQREGAWALNKQRLQRDVKFAESRAFGAAESAGAQLSQLKDQLDATKQELVSSRMDATLAHSALEVERQAVNSWRKEGHLQLQNALNNAAADAVLCKSIRADAVRHDTPLCTQLYETAVACTAELSKLKQIHSPDHLVLQTRSHGLSSSDPNKLHSRLSGPSHPARSDVPTFGELQLQLQQASNETIFSDSPCRPEVDVNPADAAWPFVRLMPAGGHVQEAGACRRSLEGSVKADGCVNPQRMTVRLVNNTATLSGLRVQTRPHTMPTGFG